MKTYSDISFEVKEVRSKEDKEAFLELPQKIYKDDPNWVCPLDKDIESVFDPALNNFHSHGIINRWIMRDQNNQTIGRVAAFINLKTAFTFPQPTGGMGFFECIEDQDAAFLLFETCRNWLGQYQIKAMDGPINFGENNAWWGLVVEGYQPPLYKNNYNPPFYEAFFEAYGFSPYFDQYYYTFDLKRGLAERYYAFGEKLSRHAEYTCKNLQLDSIEKYAADFREVYNSGWQTHDNFKEMTIERALSLFKMMKPIIDPNLVWFLYHKDVPVGFSIMIPELNTLIKRFRAGKFSILEKIQLKIGLNMKMCKVAYGSVIGFKPQYQRKGLEALLFFHIHQKLVPNDQYETLKIGWAGDFNPRVVNLYDKLGFQKVQTSRTYRVSFDPAIQVERSPIIH